MAAPRPLHRDPTRSQGERDGGERGGHQSCCLAVSSQGEDPETLYPLLGTHISGALHTPVLHLSHSPVFTGGLEYSSLVLVSFLSFQRHGFTATTAGSGDILPVVGHFGHPASGPRAGQGSGSCGAHACWPSPEQRPGSQFWPTNLITAQGWSEEHCNLRTFSDHRRLGVAFVM